MARSAIVTGGAGFVGSHVVDSLLADGYEVVVVDDLSTGAERNVAGEATLEQLDIVDGEAIRALVERVAPEAIYHLAAQASVTVSVEQPDRDCAVNVLGTLNLLEAARPNRVPLVFTSTGGALYGNNAPLPTPETFIPEPEAPYGASKWAGEAYVNTWAISHEIPHAICRLGNVYGPRQNPHGEAGVVAIFSVRLVEGQPVTVYGHGKPTRDYVHVSDVVGAMRAAAGRRGTFNVGTGVETDVLTLLGHLQDAAGTTVDPQLADLRPGELERSCLDSSLARRELGWSAQVPVERGLPETFEALAADARAGS
jgi:UDP-glucose 4-epimerase